MLRLLFSLFEAADQAMEEAWDDPLLRDPSDWLDGPPAPSFDWGQPAPKASNLIL